MGMTHLAQSIFGYVLMLAVMIVLHLRVQREFSELAFIKLPAAQVAELAMAAGIAAR